MRWKVMSTSQTHGQDYVWSLGYPTRKAASAAGRLRKTAPQRFWVEKMTPEDEALASELERVAGSIKEEPEESDG